MIDSDLFLSAISGKSLALVVDLLLTSIFSFLRYFALKYWMARPLQEESDWAVLGLQLWARSLVHQSVRTFTNQKSLSLSFNFVISVSCSPLTLLLIRRKTFFSQIYHSIMGQFAPLPLTHQGAEGVWQGYVMAIWPMAYMYILNLISTCRITFSVLYRWVLLLFNW